MFRLNVLRYPNSAVEDEPIKKSRRVLRRDRSVILVPELCQVFPFPGPLYAKCIALPSIMHRIRWLCHCIELRERWRRETGVGSLVHEESNYVGQRLMYDVEVKDAIQEHRVYGQQSLVKATKEANSRPIATKDSTNGQQDSKSETLIDNVHEKSPQVQSGLFENASREFLKIT